MSRRSRKRGTTGGQGWLGKAALGLIVLGLLVAGVLYAVVRGYLHSDAFRRFLSEKASQAAKVNGSFTPFRWDGLAVETAAFEATGSGKVNGLRVDGLHTEVGLGGLRRGVWEIRGSRLQRLELSMDARDHGTPDTFPAKEAPHPPRAEKPGWLPSEVELQGLDVRELVVNALFDQGPASASGMRVRMEPAGGKKTYRVEISDGSIRLPLAMLPEIRLDKARLRYQDRQIFLNSATASAWSDGHFELSGEWDPMVRRYSLEGGVSGVKCGEVFNEDWSKRFTGDLNTDFTCDNLGGSPTARGRLILRNGTLTALPMLDALAAYADTRRFRVLTLSEAHSDWSWKKGEIQFTNLVLASEGLTRLEGNIAIRGRELDGLFRLGLASGTLASIPGAETDVFTPGERGLLWTPLRITGTLDDPKEDLTDRLIAAAGMRMLEEIPETGEKVIKFTRSVIGESPSKAIDKGVKIIEEGTDIVREAQGVLDGFLGEKKRRDENKTDGDP